MPSGIRRSTWLVPAILIGLLAGALPFFTVVNPLLVMILLAGLIGVTVLLLGWPFSGIAVLIVAALLTRYRFDLGPVSVRFEHIAVLAVAAIAVLQYAIHKGQIRFPVAAWFALGWWLANLVAAIFFSPFPPTTLQNAARLALLVLTFILVINLIPNRRQWRWAIALFISAGVVEAAFGIVARILFPFGLNLGVQVSWNFSEPIPYGTFEEGNLFGSHTAAWALVLFMIILSIGLWKPNRRQFWQLLGLGILLLGLFFSLSRAAWLMFAAGAALLFIFYKRDSWRQINMGFILLLAAPFTILLLLGVAPLLPSSLPFVNRLQSFLTLSTDATFSARLADWALAWHDWLQHPLTGWGPGSFAVIHGELRANPAWISNLSLRLLQETGVFGVLTFAGFVLSLILPALKTSLSRPDPLDRAALLGLIISYLVLIGIAYQSTDGIWLAASWVHAGLIAAGAIILSPKATPPDPHALRQETPARSEPNP